MSPLDKIRSMGLEARQLRHAAAICDRAAANIGLVVGAEPLIAKRRVYADLYRDQAEILEMLQAKGVRDAVRD